MGTKLDLENKQIDYIADQLARILIEQIISKKYKSKKIEKDKYGKQNN